MKASKIIVKAQSKKYPIYFGSNILNNTPKIIKKILPKTKKVAFIIDKNLPIKLINKLKISCKEYRPVIYKLNSKNKIKDIKIAFKLVEDLLKRNFNRSDCVIALGGGVIGDLSAFVSSITKRGINFVNIPTTLLSQVDASVGGKTAVNSKQGKNLIGTFHQPAFVLIDISVLKTLPNREIVSGYGEILKHSIILDRKFFFWLSKYGGELIKRKKDILSHAIKRSCEIKAKIVKMDEKESSIRMILNFGHTFGHAFEASKNFSKKINHGEAVLLGMIIASEFSYKKKFLPFNDFELIKNHYIKLNLPNEIKNYFKKKDLNKIIYFMKRDKKNLSKKINLVLIKKIGKTIKPKKSIVDVREIKNFLNYKLVN